MCCFRYHEAVKVEGLLQTKEAFPIPIPEDGQFGGDVIIGWRRWAWNGSLMSPTYNSFWRPDEAVTTQKQVEPSQSRGYGIYCEDSFEKTKKSKVFGRVALWGKVLDFPKPLSSWSGSDSNKTGAMGQFGFPLELHFWHRFDAEAAVARGWGENGVEVYVLKSTSTASRWSNDATLEDFVRLA